MASRKPGANKAEKLPFDPSVNYEWSENEEFVLLGSELNTILKAFQKASSTPEFQQFLTLYHGLVTINSIFKDGVEQGLIRPKEDDRPMKKSPLSATAPSGNESPLTVVASEEPE